jgi:hypothetical protein
MHRHTTTDQPTPTPEQLAELLDRAEQNIAAQRDAYGTELDEDRAWRCAWNTWRTLTDLTGAVRALLAERDTAHVVPLRADQPTPEPMPLGRTA